MAFFDPVISKVRRKDLAQLLISLASKYHIIPNKLVVVLGQNMLATGGPLDLAFVGETNGTSFAGQVYEAITFRWLLFVRRKWGEVSVVPLEPSKARHILEDIVWDMVPSAPEFKEPHTTDSGIQGLFHFSMNAWKSCELFTKFPVQDADDALVIAEIRRTVAIAIQRNRVP